MYDQEWIENSFSQKSKEEKKRFKQFLAKVKVKRVLKELPEAHEEAFSKIDCLDCARCCKNHSPRFKTPDIKRISKYLKLKEGAFIEKYLKLDEDNDYVLQNSPCTFLNADNTCKIYEARPSDCARYPYTDEDVFLKRKALTLKNTEVCPAAWYVLKKISS